MIVGSTNNQHRDCTITIAINRRIDLIAQPYSICTCIQRNYNFHYSNIPNSYPKLQNVYINKHTNFNHYTTAIVLRYLPLGCSVTDGIECIPGSATYFMSTGVSLHASTDFIGSCVYYHTWENIGGGNLGKFAA